ncbi:MAG TPA: hypothetical protein VI636_05440 [Candidatus Angelobacter sp.]
MFCTQCGEQLEGTGPCKCGAPSPLGLVTGQPQQKTKRTDVVNITLRVLSLLIFVASVGLLAAKFASLANPPARIPGSSSAKARSTADRKSGGPETRFAIHTAHGDVSVIDFRQHPAQVSSDKTSFVVENTDSFVIAFYAPDSSFNIALESKPLKLARANAEKAFLRDLGISQNDACKLLISVGVPISVDYSAAGKDYGLSFCSGSPPIE